MSEPTGQTPRLRTVDRVPPPFPMNRFPARFGERLGAEIVCHRATRSDSRLEGTDWEQIFARCVGAEWKPSNVGLDDVVLGQCAWGLKTVKNRSPQSARSVRLISGRCSPSFSYGDERVKGGDPDKLGAKVLQIWNERVSAVRARYANLRTAVLVKSEDLQSLAVFEFETTLFPIDCFRWTWNQKENLEGHERESGEHRFTWQHSGSQFTVVEPVPDQRLLIRIAKSERLSNEQVLQAIGFDHTWVTVDRRDHRVSP